MAKTFVNVSEGAYTQSEVISASAERSVHTFEVLDYDAFEGNYALIYKDVLITHNQSQSYERENVPYAGGVYYQYLFSNGVLPADAQLLHDKSSQFTSVGTRDVTYKLCYKIGLETFYVDLATCRVSNDVSEFRLTGERLYGVSMQVIDKMMVYSFEKHLAAKTSGLYSDIGVYFYDSPLNLEDWNVDRLNENIWSRSKHVVGAITIKDGYGGTVGYREQKEYDILDPQMIYSVGVINTGK